MHLKERIVRALMSSPIRARHTEYSLLFSADDDASRPSDYLLDVALQAIQHARTVSLEQIASRPNQPPSYATLWPGEHYQLLAGLMLTLQPSLVIEIGTATGLSALAMKQALPPNGKLVTFDVVELDVLRAQWLFTDADFSDGRLTVTIDDLSQPSVFDTYRDLIAGAGFIFIDAAKDGQMEQRLLDLLKTVSFRVKPLVMFDDIRLWNMLKIWRNITFPKLDLTSFGHYTGTGLVDWPFPSAVKS